MIRRHLRIARLLLLMKGLSCATAQLCFAPNSSLVRDHLATCTSGAPSEPALSHDVAEPKDSELPSFETWRETLDQQAPKREVPPDEPAVITAEMPPETSSLSLSERPADIETEDSGKVALSAISYIHPISESAAGGLDEILTSLHARTNYASQDCAASVLRSSKASKHAGSVLNDQKDRYMLTPCHAEPKFIVVELCDEISIDTIVLANWEFFSSMLKVFRASVSEVFPGRKEDWRELGLLRASNLRGSQIFKAPLRGGFYRYIRLDFLTHYGNEYYCPVSMLQVYGRTQMDSYRDEERAKEQALRLDQVSAAYAASTPFENTDVVPSRSISVPTVIGPDSESAARTLSVSPAEASGSTQLSFSRPHASTTTTSQTLAQSAPVPSVVPSSTQSKDGLFGAGEDPAYISQTTAHGSTTSQPLSMSSSNLPSVAGVVDVMNNNTNGGVGLPEVNATMQSQRTGNATLQTQHAVDEIARSENRSRDDARLSSNAGDDIRSATTVAAAVQGVTSSSESIYGTIMKRLNALEGNATLGSRYIEEQRKLISASIAKLEKQMLHSETSRKIDGQLMRRLLLDFDLQRAQQEEERRAFRAQITGLANEIVFEKRLGLAQLFALLVVLAFVALTRGPSTVFALPQRTNRISPNIILRQRSLDRSRRAHTSLPPERSLAKPLAMLPRTPIPRKSFSNGVNTAGRHHRRAHSLSGTPIMSTDGSGSLETLQTRMADRWATSDESDGADVAKQRQPHIAISASRHPILAEVPSQDANAEDRLESLLRET